MRDVSACYILLIATSRSLGGSLPRGSPAPPTDARLQAGYQLRRLNGTPAGWWRGSNVCSRNGVPKLRSAGVKAAGVLRGSICRGASSCSMPSSNACRQLDRPIWRWAAAAWPRSVQASPGAGPKALMYDQNPSLSSGNWSVISYPAREAANLKLHADRMVDLSKVIEAATPYAAKAAAFCGVNRVPDQRARPRVRNRWASASIP